MFSSEQRNALDKCKHAWYCNRWRDSDRLLYNSYIMLNTKIKTEHYKSYFVSQLGRFILKFSLDCYCSLLSEVTSVTSVAGQSLGAGTGGWARPARLRWGRGGPRVPPGLHLMTSGDARSRRPPAWCSSSACWSPARRWWGHSAAAAPSHAVCNGEN